jgi:hypothetical protein
VEAPKSVLLEGLEAAQGLVQIALKVGLIVLDLLTEARCLIIIGGVSTQQCLRPAEPPMRPRVPLSTLCLLVAVVALTIAIVLQSARHNAELRAVTERFNKLLADRASCHNAELELQAAQFRLSLIDQTAAHHARIAAKGAAKSSDTPPGP